MLLMPRSAMFWLLPGSVVMLFAGALLLIAGSPAAANQKAAEKTPSGDAEIQKKMGRSMDVSFTDTSLADALAYFSDLTSQKIIIDKAALEAEENSDDIRVNIEVSGISAGSVLKHILAPHDLACVVEGNVLMVVPQEPALKREFKMSPDILKKLEMRIKNALKEKSEVDFTETSLADAMQFLSNLHNLNILLDERAIKEAKIDLSTNVTIKLSGKSLDETLKAILTKLKLKHVVDHEVILIQPAAKEKTRR